MKTTVIGLGYVGSVTAAGLAAVGHEVTGVDTDCERVDAYRRGSMPIHEPGLSDLLRAGFERGTFSVVHTDELTGALGDAVIVATGTPGSSSGAADLSSVQSALLWIKEVQASGVPVIMKSTVPPGSGIRFSETILGEGFDYVSNPEFLREGQAVTDWFHPARIVVGGQRNRPVELIESLYRGIEAPYVITDVTTAEMIKYASNAFLATKISFINDIAALSDGVGAVVDDVVKGISLDPRIGSAFLQPGVGYGGSCIPKDVRALNWLGLTNGYSSELLRSVMSVNSRQRYLPLQVLRGCFGRLLGVNVAVLGIAFKPGTDDIREAPSLDLIRALVDEGARVRAYDPMASQAARTELPVSVDLADTAVCCSDGAHAVVLMTEWPEIVGADWGEIARRMKPPCLLFDGRNALDALQMEACGFQYHGVGRRAAASKELLSTWSVRVGQA